MKRRSLFDIALDIILILIVILVIYWGIQLIFGGSPDLSQFNSALIIMLAGFLVKIYREIGEMRVGAKYSFLKIKEDIGSIKENMYLIKKKLKV